MLQWAECPSAIRYDTKTERKAGDRNGEIKLDVCIVESLRAVEARAAVRWTIRSY